MLTTPDGGTGERNHSSPSVLPGGRGVLFTITASASNRPDLNQVAVLDFKTGERKTLVRGASQPEYVDTGHLLYAKAGTIYAAPFDLGRLALLGDPVPVVDDLSAATGGHLERTTFALDIHALRLTPVRPELLYEELKRLMPAR